MALVPIGGARDDLYRRALQQQLMNQNLQSATSIAGTIGGQRERQALGQLLAGKAGPGLDALTREGAPGLDPNLAGPSLALTQGKMAQPGMLHTGQLTPQMAQAFMLQGGNPAALAQLMPQPPDPIEQARLGIDYQKLDLERQKMAQPDPYSVAGKIAADLGVDIRSPEGQAAVAALAKATTGGTNIELKVPPQYPAAPQGMHYAGDFATGNVSLQPTPGFAPEISGPAAAAAALVPGALGEVQQVEQSLFPQGQFDRAQALTMNAPVLGGVPNTAGEGLRAAMQAGTMAILRHESGGAITDQEIANKLSTYMPGPMDTPDVARQKFERYKRDLQNTQTVASRGRGAPPVEPQQPPAQSQPVQPGYMDQLIQQGTGLVQGLMGQGVQGAQSGGIPTVQDQAAYDALPPGAQYTVGDGVTRTKGAR